MAKDEQQPSVSVTVKREPRRSNGLFNCKYEDFYPRELIDFFDKDMGEIIRSNPTSTGKTNVEVLVQNIPTIMRFCRSIGITKKTYYNWIKRYPEFSEAAEYAKDLVEDYITSIGMASNGQFCNFMLRCNYGWRDNAEIVADKTQKPVRVYLKPMSQEKKDEIRGEAESEGGDNG